MRFARVSAALAALALAGAPALAWADQPAPPYSDLASHGVIALCDAYGHEVTSGSIYDKPFVWRAVSSVPAVAPWNGKGATAVLSAYQPRQTAYPDQWNGDTLTADSRYTDTRHPMAVATALDFSLADYLHEYPASWDGWVQLRMFLGVPGTSPLTDTYPTADLQVTGTTWRLVRGGGVPCTTGTAVSSEVGTAHLNVSATPTTSASGGSTSLNRAGAPATGANAAGSAATGGAAGASLAGTGSGHGWLVALAVVVLAAGGLVGLRRRGAR